MGRKRTKHPHLPEGVHPSKGWHFWRDPDTEDWHKLGREWDKASKGKWVEFTTGKAADGTVGALLDDFLAHCEDLVREGKRSKETHDVNLLEAEALKLSFGSLSYKAVTSKHCKTYLNRRTMQPRGIGPDGKPKPRVPAPVRANREISLLSSAYSWGMGEDNYDITSNPCYGVRRNTEYKRKRYVDTMEFRLFTKGVYQTDGALKTYVPRWVRVYCLLKRLTALPQSDMLDLDDSHITERGIIYVRNKTARTDGVPVIYRWTWALRIAVRAALALRPPVPQTEPRPGKLTLVVKPIPRPLFPSRYGTRRSRASFKNHWQDGMVAFAKDGFARFWEHDIRAKAASDTDDIEHAREMLNHATQATTKRYRRGPRKVRPAR